MVENVEHPTFLSQEISDHGYKTLGTSVILLSSPSRGIPLFVLFWLINKEIKSFVYELYIFFPNGYKNFTYRDFFYK